MSVLNQSGEEQVECPLCMEPLEVDDLNFYPCTCGYQICRFCWHRIRVDENGLCPACRKAYSENPADFTPLSQQQVLQLKAEKRARDQQRKAKLSESRKHLAAVRVVQKNLVFVVGLPVRLADAEVLKRNEYFGKFGKIHKVVINQSTSYAGSQGPSASAYVTYVKSDDALRAIQSVNNITLDGRLIKSSLGTTKYCSHFMKNQPCPKADCMYLHDFGDPEASFTKEQMHVGKHQEYEKKLHDSLQSRTQQQQQQQNNNQLNNIQQQQQQPGTGNNKGDSTTNSGQTGSLSQIATGNGDKSEAKERETREREREKERDQREKGDKKNWPTLSGDSSGGFPAKTEKPSTATKPSKKPSKPKPSPSINSSSPNNAPVIIQNSLPNSNSLKIDQNIQNSRAKQQCESNSSISGQSTITSCPLQHSPTTELQQTSQTTSLTSETLENLQKLQILDDNSSFFSNNSFQKCLPEVGDQLPGRNTPEVTRSHILNDNLPDITSSEDWQAAFGFKNDKNLQQNLENSINLSQNGLTTPINGLNGHLTQNLDQQMSKFFAEFNKNNFNLQNGFQNQENQLLLMNYQRLENEMMYNLKHNVYQQQNQPTNNQYLQQNGHSYQNGLNTEYMNGYNGFQQHQQQNSVFQNQPLSQQRNLQGLRGDRSSVDDDLGFDPFHETQKALAELIESEQSVQQIQNNGVLGSSSSAPSSSDRGPANSGAPNGLLGGSGAHLPPPPGFVQHNTHMNSFGSKILPFLNMSNNQQISNTSGWSTNNYNEAQIKGVAPVSDWMTLDPAIVSSSRHFPLSHFPLFPHHAHSHSHAHTHSHNPPMGVQQNHHTNHQNQSIFDLRQNSSQGFDIRQQPMFGVGMNGAVVGGSNNGVGVTNLGNINGGVNNLQNLQNLQNLGWFSEFQAVNSPPGFRNKGQEC